MARHVVLIDTDEAVRQGLTRILESMGLEVNPFQSGAEARRKIGNIRPVLLVIGFNRTDTSWAEFAHSLIGGKKHKRAPPIPMILLYDYLEEIHDFGLGSIFNVISLVQKLLSPISFVRTFEKYLTIDHSAASTYWMQATLKYISPNHTFRVLSYDGKGIGLISENEFLFTDQSVFTRINTIDRAYWAGIDPTKLTEFFDAKILDRGPSEDKLTIPIFGRIVANAINNDGVEENSNPVESEDPFIRDASLRLIENYFEGDNKVAAVEATQRFLQRMKIKDPRVEKLEKDVRSQLSKIDLA